MTYPSQDEMKRMIAEAGGNESRVALALDLSWAEVHQLATYGNVDRSTSAFWRTVRREASKAQGSLR